MPLLGYIGSRRTTQPNMSGAVADAAETADIASGVTGSKGKEGEKGG